MCEFVSVLATVSGPIQVYASPSMNSHGDAREVWYPKLGASVNDMAEVEWTSESPDYLEVRHEDPDTERVVKAMILKKWPTRKKMIKDIKVAKNPDCPGERVIVKNGVKRYECFSDGSAIVKNYYDIKGRLHRDKGAASVERFDDFVAYYYYKHGEYISETTREIKNGRIV